MRLSVIKRDLVSGAPTPPHHVLTTGEFLFARAISASQSDASCSQSVPGGPGTGVAATHTQAGQIEAGADLQLGSTSTFFSKRFIYFAGLKMKESNLPKLGVGGWGPLSAAGKTVH